MAFIIAMLKTSLIHSWFLKGKMSFSWRVRQPHAWSFSSEVQLIEGPERSAAALVVLGFALGQRRLVCLKPRAWWSWRSKGSNLRLI